MAEALDWASQAIDLSDQDTGEQAWHSQARLFPGPITDLKRDCQDKLGIAFAVSGKGDLGPLESLGSYWNGRAL